MKNSTLFITTDSSNNASLNQCRPRHLRHCYDRQLICDDDDVVVVVVIDDKKKRIKKDHF